MFASFVTASSKAFSVIYLKNTFSSLSVLWICYLLIVDPFFSFLHLSITIDLTILFILSRSKLYFPEAANSVKNCYFLLDISLILKVETLEKLLLMFILLSSLVWSFYFEKNEEYSWLIALIPFLISSFNRANKLSLFFFG